MHLLSASLLGDLSSYSLVTYNERSLIPFMRSSTINSCSLEVDRLALFPLEVFLFCSSEIARFLPPTIYRSSHHWALLLLRLQASCTRF